MPHPAHEARRRTADEGGALGTGRPAAGAASSRRPHAVPARAATRVPGRRGLVTATVLALLAAGCAQSPAASAAPARGSDQLATEPARVGGSAAPAADRTEPAAHDVTYALAWAIGDVATAPDGTGFVVTSDLGYTVHVTRGWISSYGMELVECPRATAPTPIARAGALLGSLLVSEAWAGHSSDTPNPAAIHPMQIESLTEPRATDVATLQLAPQAYCKLHYLLARAGAEARDLPAQPDLVGTSLRIEGTWRAPGTDRDVPFTLQTASAYGALLEHAGDDAQPLYVDTGAGATRVTLRRNRARMFDGVDFARMPERAAAMQVLRATVEHVDVQVAPARARVRP